MHAIIVKKLNPTGTKGDRFKAFIAPGLPAITEQSDYEDINIQPMKMAAKLIRKMGWDSSSEDWHGGNLSDGSWVFVCTAKYPTAIVPIDPNINIDYQFSIKM